MTRFLPLACVSLVLVAAEVSADATGACDDAVRAALQATPLAFHPGTPQLAGRSQAMIDLIAEQVAECPEARIEIVGHTDNEGDETENLRLSAQRAEAVATALASRGVRIERMLARGVGSSQPVARNTSRRGRALNRRVTIRLRSVASSQSE